MSDFNPNWATHPGEHLFEYMKTMEVSMAWLSVKTDLPEPTIRDILNKERPVTGVEASDFEEVFGLKASIWLGLQENWDKQQKHLKERGVNV